MIDEVITPTHVGYTGGRGSGNSAGRGSNRRPQPIDEDMIAPSTARPTGGRGGPPGRTADPVPAGRGSNRRPQPIDEDMIAPSTVRPTGGRGGPPGRMADAVMEKADEVFAPSRSSGRRIQPPPKPMVDEVIEPTNVNSPRRRGKPPPTMVDEEIVPSHVNPTGGGGRGKPKQQQPVNEEIVPTRVNPSNRREKAPQMVDEVVIPTNVVPSGRRGRPPPQTVNDHEYSNNVGPSGRHGKPPQTTDEEPTAGRPGRQKPNEDKRRKPAEVNGSSNHPRMPNGNGTTTTTSETRRVIQPSQPSVQTYTKTTRHVTYRTATTVESEESESEYTEEEATPPGTPEWKRKVNWNLGSPPAPRPTTPPEDEEDPDGITEGTKHVEITGNRVITTTRKVRKVKKEVPEPVQPNGPFWSSTVKWSSEPVKKKPPPIQITKQEQRVQVSPPQMVPAPVSPRIIVAEATLPRPQYIQQTVPLQQVIQTIQPQQIQQMPVATQPQQLYILQTQPTATIDGGMRALTLPRGQTQQAYLLPTEAFLGTQTLPGRGQQIRILDGGSSYRVDSGSSIDEVDRSVQNLQQSIHELHGVNTMRSTRSRVSTSASGYDTHLRPSAYSEVSTFRHRSVSQSSIDGKSEALNATICVSCKRPFGPHDKMGTYRGSPCHETCMPNSPTEKPASTCVACHIKFHPDDKMVLLNGKPCHEMCLPKVTDEQNTSIRKVRTMSSSRSQEPATPTSPSVSVRKFEMGTSQSRMQYLPPPTPGTPGSAMSTSTHYTWGGEVTPHTPFSAVSNTSGFTMEMVRQHRQVEGEDVFMCFYCNKPIRGQVVGAFNKVFHEGHFACCCCHRRFKRGQKFYELDERPMCKKCCRAFPGNEVDSKWGFTMGRR
ncbi:hypothetical protein Bbelb_179740 [Branchiostoma belcheri]|nr:hypothetical protein Bbelb_179740 [Branchiostoma belcheri]